MRPVAFDLATEFDLVTFTVIVGMWLTTIWLAYRIGLQSVRDEHDEADRPQIQSFKIRLTSAEGLPTVQCGTLRAQENNPPASKAKVPASPMHLPPALGGGCGCITPRDDPR